MDSMRTRVLHLVCLTLFSIPGLHAAADPPKQDPDILVFTDGEKLIGQLERATAETVTFKSDMAGEVTVEWSKIKELHSSRKFAVIEKGVKLSKRADTSKVPQGTVSASGQTLTVQPAPGAAPQNIPVASAARVIDEPTFQSEVVETPGPLQAWSGTVTAGTSLVEATQHSETFTGSIHLVRTIPTVSWMEPRNRTIVDFSTSYGKVSQPNTPTLKTDIYHAGAERDEYFTDRVYAFGQASFDHNFSQGLDLEQEYGGGIGWTVIKTAKETLDLKASLNYAKEQFQQSSANQDLFGSIFAEDWTRKFLHQVTFVEQLSITPAWNNLNAYAAAGSATLAVPVYKRLSFSVGVIDMFLNNPPPAFKKNSFQLTAGLTYTLQ
jgi:putative salt-induced outer membrane protein YdiY